MNRIKSLSIYLGSNCNLNCAYCHREDNNEKLIVGIKLIALIKEKQPKYINFFGGEPTLYIDCIKKIVSIAPNTNFTITTNGILLDKYIEYFKEHNFRIILSYDGNDNKNIRKFNPLLKEICYSNIGISTTLYHGNTDIKKIIRNFCNMEKNVKRPLYFYPHIMHYTNNNNKKFALTVSDVNEIIEWYKDIIQKFWNDYCVYGLINIRYSSIFTHLLKIYKTQYKFGETYCIGSDRLKVDIEGNSFNCLYIRTIQSKDNEKYMLNNFPQCKKCKYYSMCGGGCVQSLTHNIECKFYYELYDFFTKFIKSVSQDKLNKLEGILKC